MNLIERLRSAIKNAWAIKAVRRTMLIAMLMIAVGIIWLVIDHTGGKMWQLFMVTAISMLLWPLAAVDR